MYTLVSASLLGFDLTRLTGGARVAEVLSWALGVEADAVPALDALHAETTIRDAAWLRLSAAVGGAPDLLTVLTRTRWDTADPAEALALLTSAPLGSFDALLRLVRDDVFDWLEQPAADRDDPPGRGTVALVSDAVAAAYAEDQLSPVDRRTLSGPWLAALARMGPRRPRLGPRDPAVRELVDRLARATPGERARLGTAADRLREHRRPWVRAMHAATWAAHLTHRTRAAAAAQLAAVIALRKAGVTAGESAAGTWNVVSGAVQGLAVADLLPPADLDTLLRPVAAAC